MQEFVQLPRIGLYWSLLELGLRAGLFPRFAKGFPRLKGILFASHVTASSDSSPYGRIVIVIVNSIFLQRPQMRSRGNQLIHRRLQKKVDRQRVRSRESG